MMKNQENLKKDSANRNKAAVAIQQDEENLRLSDAELMEETIPREVSTAAINTPSLRFTKPYKFVPLAMGGNGRTHKVSNESRRLIE